MSESNITDQPQGEAPKLLDIDFTKSGVKYHQIQRQGDLAVYRRESPNWVDYEVVKVRVQKASEYTIKSGEKAGQQVVMEHKELYPTDEMWGEYGWTLQNEELANRKLEEVRDRPKSPVCKSKKAPLESFEGQDTGNALGGLE